MNLNVGKRDIPKPGGRHYTVVVPSVPLTRTQIVGYAGLCALVCDAPKQEWCDYVLDRMVALGHAVPDDPLDTRGLEAWAWRQRLVKQGQVKKSLQWRWDVCNWVMTYAGRGLTPREAVYADRAASPIRPVGPRRTGISQRAQRLQRRKAARDALVGNCGDCPLDLVVPNLKVGLAQDACACLDAVHCARAGTRSLARQRKPKRLRKYALAAQARLTAFRCRQEAKAMAELEAGLVDARDGAEP